MPNKNNYTIKKTTDTAFVRDFLSSDESYTAYALGDLEEPYASQANWYTASVDEQVKGLGLIYTGLSPTVLFLFGTLPAVEAILHSDTAPQQIYLTAKPEAADIIKTVYDVEAIYHMFRMRLHPKQFSPMQPDANTPLPRRLDADDVDEINRLQREASAHDSRDMRDIAFDPVMVGDGYYYGIFVDNRLKAVAGTHLTAKREAVAAVGNVVVHPDSRGKHWGTVVSQAVTKALIDDGFRLIVLNVRQDNIAAIKTYERLGYQITGEFIEGLASRAE
ncbi:MAG: GNAT family N-acetyltransferase [Anaerolineae bacterium]|nr:GNAT family N-acetyltransferase [Anaerolineae bacterium]